MRHYTDEELEQIRKRMKEHPEEVITAKVEPGVYRKGDILELKDGVLRKRRT